MRVLVLPRHTSQAASCRHRFLQFLPALRERGIDCDVAPFFDEKYTAAVLSEGKPGWRFARALIGRTTQMLRARDYDLVVVHFELVPFLPYVFERVLIPSRIPIVVDFDDAIFHVYDRHTSAAVRTLLGDKLGRLMGDAALCCAGSEYLAAYARRFSSNVAVVPTVVDLRRFPASQPSTAGDTLSIGWIGSPSTTPHLRSIAGELAAFCRGRRAEVVAIGAHRFDAGDLPIRWLPWTEDTEVRDLARTDVGIMPLPDTPFTRGKCGFKLIQAMACWKPVVASPVGANCHIVDDGATGLFARDGEWGSALARLYDDPLLRERLGAAGRDRVVRDYSLDVWAPRVAALWTAAARREAVATPWAGIDMPRASRSCAE